jgi:hypothetical protein
MFGSAVDQIMAEARALGFQRVIWMTTGRPGSNSTQVNTILRQKAATNARMQIADWVAFSGGHPDWFWPDGGPSQDHDRQVGAGELPRSAGLGGSSNPVSSGSNINGHHLP